MAIKTQSSFGYQYKASLSQKHILISAFVCEPNSGSEPDVGWRWALEMAKHAKVTVVTQAKNRGRIERYLANFPECAHNIEFVYLAPPLQLEKLRKKLRTCYYIMWQSTLRKWIRQQSRSGVSYDLIHHVTFASFRYPIFLKGLDFPVVWGPVGGAENAPKNLVVGRGSFTAKLKEILRNISMSISKFLLIYMDPTNCGRNGVALASTPRMKQIFEEKKLPCELIPTIGIPDEDYKHAKLAFKEWAPGQEVKILYVGRLHFLKGVDLFLLAMSSLKKELWKLDLVGDGPERACLEQLCHELGLTDRVQFLGQMSKADLGDVFGSHDLLVAPSLYESGGMVAIEAMTSACPVVVLDVGGHQISVDEGNGIKISPEGSVDDVVNRLREAIRHYLNNPMQLKEDGARARQSIAEKYLWSIKGRKMARVYESVIHLNKES